MADETAKTNLVYDASGAQRGAEQFAAASDKVIQANDRVLKSTDRQAAALDRFAKQWNPVLAAAERAGRQLDSVFDIFQKTEGSIKTKAFDLLGPAIDRANEALRNLAAGYDVAARIGQLSAKFDPVTTSARAMVGELKDLNDAQKLLNLSSGQVLSWQQKIIEKYDEGAQAAKRAAQAQRDLIEQGRAEQARSNASAAQGAFNQQLGVGGSVKSAAQSASVFQEQFEAEEKLAAETQRLINLFDPLTAASQRYADKLGIIKRAEDLNVVSAREANKLRAEEAKSYGSSATNVDAATKYLGNFRDAAFGARFASQQLGVQTIQFFSSLQAGQPFMQAFIGQAHQVIDVAIATGTGFRTIGNAIAGWITGLANWVRANPIVAGATAAVAALTALGAMSESTQRRLGTLRTELSGTRDDYQQASARAEEASKFLARSTFLSTADSRKAAQTIFSDPTFNGTDEQVQRIAVTFSNLSKVLHESETNWKRMADAMQDPAKAIDELAGHGLTQITSGLRRTVTDLANSGHSAEAFRMILEALEKQTAGVENNLTPLQKALNELSKEFTSAAQGGRSMADLVGSIVDTAAVAAVGTLTEIVKEFKAIYDLIKDLKPPASWGDFAKDFWDTMDLSKLAKDSASGIRNLFDLGGTRDWLRQQAASPGAEITSVSSAGALGTMQLMPATAKGLNVNPFIQSENIRGGVQYIQQLAKRFGDNTDLISRAYNAGPSGNLTAVGGYAAKVAGADISKLPNETVTQIETAGRSIGLSAQLIDLAKRIAAVENQGRQGPVNAAARYVDPSKGGEVRTGLSPAEAAVGAGTGTGTGGPADRDKSGSYGTATGKGDMTYQQAIALAEQYRVKLGLVADAQHENEIGLEALKKGRQAAFDQKDTAEVERLDKAIAAMTGKVYQTIGPQEQLARQLKQQAEAAQALTEGDQKLLQVQQQLDELNKQHPDTASAENDAKIRSAALQQMSGEFRRLTFETGLQIKEQNALAEAYGQGYDAVAHVTAANKALIDSFKFGALGSNEQKAAAKALTEQYEALARAQDQVKAAQMHAANRDTVTMLNAEVDALGMSSLERERYLAHVQKEIELKRELPNLSAEARNALLAENDAIVAQQQALKTHQQAMDEIAGSFQQSFETIGNAITQSFVQGTGAAVNWSNVLKSVLQQVVQQFTKLAVLNPILNAAFPGSQHRPTLDDAFNTPEKMALPANDNTKLNPVEAIKNAAGLGGGGLPIDTGVNAMRVTVVGGAGGLLPTGAEDAMSAAKSAADAVKETASDTKEVGTAASGGGLLSRIGKSIGGLFGGGSSLGGGGGGGGGSTSGGGSGFLGSIGKLFSNFPGGLLNSVFGDKFYENGGLLGSLFGSGSAPTNIPVDTGAPQIFSDAGIVGGAQGVVDSGSWDLGGIGDALGALHSGGLVGVDRLSKHAPVNPLVWAGAPRLHTGLNSDEFAAVLQRGERVLTANQNMRLEGMLGSALPRAGGAGAAAMSRAMGGMAANRNARGGDINNNGHTIHINVAGPMSGDQARRTGYQVANAVAGHLQKANLRGTSR